MRTPALGDPGRHATFQPHTAPEAPDGTEVTPMLTNVKSGSCVGKGSKPICSLGTQGFPPDGKFSGKVGKES